MSEAGFKDLFSLQATDYARYRPRYPEELFRFLGESCASHALAWDCGTGSGQAALALAPFFARVIATDPSAAQLAQAEEHPKVEYRQATAEASSLPSASVDLITVAQAFHWFRQEEFFRECSRVARPGGLLALWCYELALIEPAVDELVLGLYRETLGSYWDPERRLVEEGYRQVRVPFPEFPPPMLSMEARWNLPELLGYLGTWSALQKYRNERGTDPRRELAPRLEAAWGDPGATKLVRWPLALRVFRITE